MTRRFRCYAPEDDAWSWYETGDDGRPRREAVFAGALPVPTLPEPFSEPLSARGTDAGGTPRGAAVAASCDQLRVVREEFGPLGVQLYEAVYGVMTPGPVVVPGDAEPVTEAEFESAWARAVFHRHFTRYDSGPLPQGARVTGTVSVLPWGPGRTGLFVALDALDVPAFVDMAWLPRDPGDWPPVGTVAAFEVTTIRFDLRPEYTGLQVRLRPTAVPPPGEP
ncbi:hypothetical protein ACFVTY_00915 [Streptomyces sp. NPDC058067]|uniref:hypothetical protein n=1 Tax=Streptomyces sp. NPDC058067 TaxID=3346324 RepID=UPI0036ED0D42